MTYSPVFKHAAHSAAGILTMALLLGLGLPAAAQVVGASHRNDHVGGYLIIPHSGKVDQQYNAGYSMYVAAWPLLSYYPGHRSQSGLPGTWMFAQYDGAAPRDMYSDVEGELGWWTDTVFPTTTPKFIMRGVGPNFSEIANGPAHGAGTWKDPRGLYEVAQLSPWLLFPMDGLITIPQYYRLENANDETKAKWTPVTSDQVPTETGLQKVRWTRPAEAAPEPLTTPDDPASCWKKPGPVAGPFKARLGDGSVVTYYWYRFADQPALQNADLTPEERERLQARVENLQRAWPRNRNYIPPPTTGKLANLDPAQIVKPPKGLEIGYVPIATRQELGIP